MEDQLTQSVFTLLGRFYQEEPQIEHLVSLLGDLYNAYQALQIEFKIMSRDEKIRAKITEDLRQTIEEQRRTIEEYRKNEERHQGCVHAVQIHTFDDRLRETIEKQRQIIEEYHMWEESLIHVHAIQAHTSDEQPQTIQELRRTIEELRRTIIKCHKTEASLHQTIKKRDENAALVTKTYEELYQRLLKNA